MARKISGGLVGEPSVGAINIAPTAVLTTALNQDIGFANNIILNSQNDIRFADSDSSNWVAFQAPSTITSDVTWTLPSTDGTINQILSTNGAGILSWTDKTVNIEDNIVDSAVHYLTLTTASTNTAVNTLRRSSSKLSFQPSTGVLDVTGISASTLTVTGDTVFTGSVRMQEFVEDVVDAAVGSNTATLNYSDGSIFFTTGTPSANITVNLTNAPTTDGRTFIISLVVTQGATGRIPSVFQIGGSGQTIRWAFGITPTATANKIDIFNFQLIRRAGAWTVLGSANTNF